MITWGMFSRSTAPQCKTLSAQWQSLAGLSAHRSLFWFYSTQQWYWDLFCCPKAGILLLFRQGPLHLIFNQLIHDSTFVTVYPGRPRQHGNHPQLLGYTLSSGSFGSISMGSQVELPYRASGNRQVLIFFSLFWVVG